jgi:hypothetical protein
MSPLRWTLLLLLVAPALLAGCMGPKAAEATPPSGNGTTPVFRGPAGFQVEGPVILSLDGTARPLREDDGALIRYTLKQPAEAANASTALVSFLLNGKVEDVETVTLAPGQSRSWERKVETVRDLPEVRVEVRGGSALGKAAAPVQPWPRLGEWLDMSPRVRVNVDSWSKDDASAQTVVRATVMRGASPFQEFRAHLLCVDAKGGVKSEGVVRPELQPQPGTAEVLELRLPLCPGETYGVDFKADLPDGTFVYGRVLFVPKGWTPPAATA